MLYKYKYLTTIVMFFIDNEGMATPLYTIEGTLRYKRRDYMNAFMGKFEPIILYDMGC